MMIVGMAVVLFIGGLACLMPAMAATIDISGRLDADGYYPPTPMQVAPGPIRDVYNLTLSSGRTATFQAQVFDLGPFFVIDRLDMVLHEGADGTGGILGRGGPSLSRTLSGGVPYSLVVTGKATGTVGGSYVFGAVLTPVPLPGSFWLMSGAIGLVVVVAGRRLRRGGGTVVDQSTRSRPAAVPLRVFSSSLSASSSAS